MQERFPILQGFNISPPIRVNGGHLLSLCGPLGTVASYVAIQNWHPRNIVAFGQNGACPGVSRTHMRAHMIVVFPDHNMVDTAGSIDQTIVNALKQDEFDYAHLVAGFNNGVRLVVFGESFAINPFGELVLDALFRTFFNNINTLNGSEDASNVLLLIGSSGERTMCAKIAGRDNTYRMLSSPFAGPVESRHAVVGKSLLLTVGYDKRMIYGIDAETLVDFLTADESALMWAEHQIGHSIEDIAVVDGVRDTIIVTLSDGDFRLVPTIVRIRDDQLELNPSTSEGVRIEDLGGEVISPIVRVGRGGQEIVLVCQDGRSTMLRFEHPSAFGSKFEDMVMRACSRKLSAHHL